MAKFSYISLIINIITGLVVLGTIVFGAGTLEGKINAIDKSVDKHDKCIEHINEALNKNAIDIGVIKATVIRIEKRVK